MSSSKSPAAVAMTKESIQAPDRSRDVRVGLAVIPYGFDNYDQVSGSWRLPGRRVTKDITDAYRAADIMNRIMEREANRYAKGGKS
jgi:hypothetical protein